MRVCASGEVSVQSLQLVEMQNAAQSSGTKAARPRAETDQDHRPPAEAVKYRVEAVPHGESECVQSRCPPLHWSSVRSGDASGGTVCRHVSGALTWMSCHMRPGAWGFVETMFLHLGSVCGPRRPTVCCVRLRISFCWFYTLLTSRTHERPLRLSEAWQLGIIPFLVDGDTWQQR